MAENNLCPDRFTDEHKIQMDLNSNDDRQMMILADDQDPKDLPTADNHFLSGVQSWVNKSSETRNTMHRLMHVISDTLEVAPQQRQTPLATDHTHDLELKVERLQSQVTQQTQLLDKVVNKLTEIEKTLAQRSKRPKAKRPVGRYSKLLDQVTEKEVTIQTTEKPEPPKFPIRSLMDLKTIDIGMASHEDFRNLVKEALKTAKDTRSLPNLIFDAVLAQFTVSRHRVKVGNLVREPINTSLFLMEMEGKMLNNQSS